MKGASFGHCRLVRVSLEGIEQRVRDRKPGRLTLAEAQFLIARAHSFTTWRDFAQHIERLARMNADVDAFEAAADAVVTGGLATLESLLRENLNLIHTRSVREHRATLLHYVAANGIEDFRQLTPSNAVAIAKSLLEDGSEVDALANTYGGGKAQTTIESAHFEHASSQCWRATGARRDPARFRRGHQRPG